MRRLPRTQPLRPSGRLSRRSGRAFAGVLLVGSSVWIAGCRDLTGPLPRTGTPTGLEFAMAGFGVTGTNVELRGDTVVLWQRPWDWTPNQPVDTLRAIPTADSWRAFWTAVDRAGVHRWRRQYVAEGIVDGSGWTLRIEAGGQVVESYGSNAYPDRLGFKRELELTDDFRAFLTALGELVGDPDIFWTPLALDRVPASGFDRHRRALTDALSRLPGARAAPAALRAADPQRPVS